MFLKLAHLLFASSLIPAKSLSWVKTTSRWFDPRIATVYIHGLCFATRVALAEQEAASIRGEFRDVSHLGGHGSFLPVFFLLVLLKPF